VANKSTTRKPSKPTAKKAAAGQTTQPRVAPARNGKATDDDVRRRAYEKWEAAGRPDGDGACFWLQAERELMQKN
jgi:hypothetical protein